MIYNAFEVLKFDHFRQTGLTTKLMSIMMIDPNATLVVHNFHEKERLAKLYNMHRNRFLTADAFRTKAVLLGKEGSLLFDLPAIETIVATLENENEALRKKLKEHGIEL